MGKSGVKHEGLGLAECIDHTVQKSHKKSGVEAHRARGVEQHNEPQRFYLTASPGEIKQGATVRNIAVNGTTQIKSSATLPNLFTADQSDPHDSGQANSERMRRSDFVRIDDVEQIGRGQEF